MTKTSDEKSSKLKPYQMILLSCLLGTLMIINSNHVNYNRDLAKLNKEKGELFDSIINTRKLSSGNRYSIEVCSRASDDLKKYYQTGDPSIIDVNPEKSIECEDKDKAYMKALINIVRTAMDDSEEDSNPFSGADGTGERRNLRNLGGISDVEQQDLTDYGMRFLAMGVFLVFGILSIFGWIFCCICCCCDCCCCCCLKKTSCKIPCFIFTYVFYALVVAISIYGLVQSNKIFVGLADTECSMLKFFEQVLDGEMKQDLPKWAGIERIKGLLTNLKTTINQLSLDSHDQLNDKMDGKIADGKDSGLNEIRDNFIDYMKGVGDNFYDNNAHDYKDPYTYTDSDSKKYVYDMVYNFGRYEEPQGYTDLSYLYLWNQEFSAIDGSAYGYLTDAQDDFNDILRDNIGDVTKALDDGIDNLDDLTSPFTDANDEIGKILSDVSESIDTYGKMSVKIIFGGLMAMNVALAALMLLICMFSGKSCTSCCCCRCLFKFCTHILWNVLALLMILTFIFGSLISLLGRFGGDAMSLVSYIMSIDNFNGTNPLIVDKLGKAKDYIYTCMHGDGDIAKQLGLGSSLDSFTGINNVESNISSAKNTFENLKSQTLTYNLIKNKLDKQKDYAEDITMYRKDSLTEKISYNSSLEKINDILQRNGKGDRWSNYSENKNLDCIIPPATPQYYHPIKCKPYTMDGNYGDLVDYTKYSNYLRVLDTFKNKAISNDAAVGTDAPSVIKVVEDLNREYKKYLNCYVNILEFFLDTIGRITGLIRPLIGDGDAFSFLNGKFIGTNLKIILKYLEHSLGGDFFTVGICLCIVGLSLILSISSTIILIVIINIGLKEAMDQNKMMPGGDPQVVSQFDMNMNNPVPNMPKAY